MKQSLARDARGGVVREDGHVENVPGMFLGAFGVERLDVPPLHDQLPRL